MSFEHWNKFVSDYKAQQATRGKACEADDRHDHRGEGFQAAPEEAGKEVKRNVCTAEVPAMRESRAEVTG